MLNDMLRSLRGHVFERTVSPLGGTFVVVWLACNWKAVAVLIFGGADITSRIQYVEEHYVDAYVNLWYPLAITLLIVSTYPVLASVAFYWWEKMGSWQRKTRRNLDLDVPLSIPQTIELKKQLAQVNQVFVESMASTNVRVSDLEKENQQLKDELAALKPKSAPEDVAGAEKLAAELATMRERLAAMEKLEQDNSALREQLARLSVGERRDRPAVEGAAVASGEIYGTASPPGGRLPLPQAQEAGVLEAIAAAEDEGYEYSLEDLITAYAGRTRIPRTKVKLAIERLTRDKQIYVTPDASRVSLTMSGREQAIANREET